MTRFRVRVPAIAVAVAALLTSLPAAADPVPYTLDRSHAGIRFQVSHLGFSNTFGQFRRFDTDIRYDAEHIEKSSVIVTIDAASVDTNWPRRDAHIRGDDFLDVERYPLIVFRSTSIDRTGRHTAALTGELTIRGVTREETFDVTLSKVGVVRAKQVIGLEATGVIDRTRYEIHYAAPAIGTDIPVTISLEMSPS